LTKRYDTLDFPRNFYKVSLPVEIWFTCKSETIVFLSTVTAFAFADIHGNLLE